MVKLTQLKNGQGGKIARLDTDNEGILRKLMSLGLLPGVSIKLIQAYPAYVFQADYTQVAVDFEIASAIIIELD